jgi:CheY-like chemotaxis protein
MGYRENGVALIADDNEIVRELVHSVLNRLGFSEVIEVENGEDAWTEVQKAKYKGMEFRLIVSDIDMPRMNGIEFLHKVREQGQNTPFLLLTAHSEKELVQEAILIGVTQYLTKPFGMDTMEKKVRETLAPKK